MAAPDLMEGEPQRVASLRRNYRALRAGLQAGGLQVRDDPTPILPVITRADDAALRLARRVFGPGGVVAPPPFAPPPPQTHPPRGTGLGRPTEPDAREKTAAGV